MAYNKIIFGGETLIDLTADTITPEALKKGVTAHDKSGETITGTSTLDVDSSDATAAQAEILLGQTAYARGVKLTGTMPNNGATIGVLSDKDGVYTIPQGYHDGSGTVSIDRTEQEKLVPGNIRQGITVLGVLGTMSGSEDVKAQEKTVTPAVKAQSVTPDEGFNYLSAVTVAAIPYVEASNAAGGTTVTIAG